MKKVLIVTLAQGANYGGIAQAYAMQCIIKNTGLDSESTSSQRLSLRAIFRSVPGLSLIYARIQGRQIRDMNKATVYTRRFIDKNIKLVSFSDAKKGSRNNEYKSYVVGSDQVWRAKYTYIPHNLFSFVKSDAIKISYAASFGKDNLDEYGSRLIEKTKKLAQKFNAISVREDSGVNIVEEHWGLEAEHHVDPTLLVDAAQYFELIDNPTSELYAPNGDLFSYVLDTDESKQGIADTVAANRGLKVFTVIDGDENGGKPMPPVEQWLRSFRDAKYIVTDSFHGTVFSIIFNKPFIAIGNKERGLARFTSLLKMFGLEDRLVTSADQVTKELINKPIDWSAVNTKIKYEQKRSFDYLKKHLE